MNLNAEPFIIIVNKTYIYICKATGLDGLPAKFIIDSAESIVKPLAYIVNLSIESGVFPDDLKRAKIVPLLDKHCCNYILRYQNVATQMSVSLIIVAFNLNYIIINYVTKYDNDTGSDSRLW